MHERLEENNIKNIDANLFDSKDPSTHEKWNQYYKLNLLKNIEKENEDDLYKILVVDYN